MIKNKGKLVRELLRLPSKSRQKIFYSRDTIKGISISSLAELPPLHYDWLNSLN